MKKQLRIITSPKNHSVIEIVREVSIYCNNDYIYFTHDKNLNPQWMEMEIQRAKKEVEMYRNRYENVLRGLMYWKTKNQTRRVL